MSSGPQFDDLYIQIASRVKGIDELLDSFMGFLHRKTDFFVEVPVNRKSKSGFPKGIAESMILKSFKKFPMRLPSEDDMKALEKPALLKPSALSAKPAVEVLTDASSSAKNSTVSQNSKSVAVSKESNIPRLTEDGKQIPVGNGGFSDNYYWTQTLKDLSVFIDVAPGTKSKDIQCTIAPNKLSLQIRSNEGLRSVIVGDFEYAVRVDESMWTINTSADSNTGAKYSQILITLDKIQHTWWKHVIKGHGEIDTSKVDSSQNIGDYDEQTQATIRKLMFEQKQQVLFNIRSSFLNVDVPFPLQCMCCVSVASWIDDFSF